MLQPLRLRGPAAGDPTGRILHNLLVGLLVWTFLESAVALPFFVVRKEATVILLLFLSITLSVSLVMLRRGLIRQASLAYLVGTGLANAVTLVLSGGVHSANIAIYITLPISAAWLLGYRAMLWTAAVCIGSSLLTAILEINGIGPWHYFPLPPFVVWTLIVESTVISAVPVAQLLKILRQSLAQSQSDRAALRDYQDRLEELVQERTEELVVARDQAQAARHQAEAANQAKTAFLASVSHELRTPLNSILGFSSLLRDGGGTSGAQRKDLDIIYRSGEHLLGLINKVLDVAKIESGRMRVDAAPCDLRRLAREIAEMTQGSARAKNLQLLVEECPGFTRFVRTDASKVREILINLIANAVEYTERGSVILRLGGLRETASNRLLLRLEVVDTGVGIAAAEHVRIFEPFVQVGATGAPKGTGLGLAIVKQYAELMGGSVGLESVPGQGSQFRVELPVELAEEAEVTPPPDLRQRVVRIEPGQPEFRILVVEDELEGRLLLQRLLADAGFLVRVAEDGVEGVEIFQSWRPHFIWIDRRMPGLSGLEAVRRIRELEGGRDVKIVGVTASVLPGQGNGMLEAGMDDFLRKPYRPAEIFDCMARHLGVRYVHAEEVSGPVAPETTALRPEALAALPEETREELSNAIRALDALRIATIIRGISEVDPPLGATLAQLADRLTFTPILRALRMGCI
ncbi:MAG: ATP-binding protein [Candidatus Solibacter sp.]|nr:ATP-binding protein [Candidatus Solibacter sp.]